MELKILGMGKLEGCVETFPYIGINLIVFGFEYSMKRQREGSRVQKWIICGFEDYGNQKKRRASNEIQ